jgi:multiple sugar transport system permease protein
MPWRNLRINRTMKTILTAYLFLLPALFLLGVWQIYPLVQTFIMSFQEVNFFDFSNPTFVGLDNYRELLQDRDFGWALKTTVIFVCLVVPVQTCLSFLLAVLLNSLNKGKSLFRTAFFIPYVTSTVAVTVVFMRLFTKDGGLTELFHALGLPNVSWFSDVDLALPFLALVYIWMNFGFFVILFLSGLQTVPKEVYDAAVIDGAGRAKVLRYITLPLVKPFVFLVLVTGIINAFQMFDQAFVISRGGSLGSPAGATMTLVIFIYSEAFRNNNMGYASAASVMLLLIVVVVTALLRINFKDD